MVQVDIFWSYGIGAGLAVAAHRQIQKQKEDSASVWKNALRSPFFTKALLFLGLVFVPSGFWLLWQFSSWETMHAAGRDLPVWLVGLFAITNVSQGVLGFVICHYLIRRGSLYAAWLNFIGAYFGMFFILVHGWDGKGYQRFFSPDREAFESWTWQTAGSWFTSDVAFTLYGMGVILIPVLGGMTIGWVREGLRETGRNDAPLATLGGFLGSILVFALGLAIVSSVALIQLGLIPGTLCSVLFILVLTHKRWGLGPWFYRWMTFESSPTLQKQ